MTREHWVNRYFDWMYRRACGPTRKSYRKLLMAMYDIEFIYYYDLDSNRAVDGEDLRERFAYETTHNDAIEEIMDSIDTKPCSVLEMMLGLCIRSEEHIMNNPNFGDRTYVWFMEMIKNLGLDDMTDEKFNKVKVLQTFERLMNHEYAEDGTGGLFTIHNPKYNMRTAEFWYQMMWYLDEI